MQADPAAQLKLLDLAALDTQLAQLAHRRTTLPEHARLQELRAQHQQLSEELVAAETRLSDAQAGIQRVESDLGPARERLQRNQQRVDSGSVADAKALRGLVDEIDHLRGRIGKLEDDELEQMQLVEDATADRDEVAARRRGLEEQARELIGKRDSQLKDLTDEAGLREASRTTLVASLPADLVALYEKIRGRAGGIGAAELRAGRCGGCKLTINSTELARIASAAPADVVRCDECDRILVRTSESGL